MVLGLFSDAAPPAAIAVFSWLEVLVSLRYGRTTAAISTIIARPMTP